MKLSDKIFFETDEIRTQMRFNCNGYELEIGKLEDGLESAKKKIAELEAKLELVYRGRRGEQP